MTPLTMKAIRLHPSSETPHSATGAAPASALHYDREIPVPKLSTPGEILIRVKASTIVRDMLAWPEMLARDYQIPGHDFAGIVEAVYDSRTSRFGVGDEVFGMVHADRGGMWAEFAVVREDEAVLKPKSLSFVDAAAVPLSGLTAWQALFHKASLPQPSVARAAPAAEDSLPKRVLVTGASGAVGVWLVQLATLAGCRVTAATSSDERNRQFLLSHGAVETLEYLQLNTETAGFDVIVDCVGGDVLSSCWSCIVQGGVLISIDSASWNFVGDRKTTAGASDNVKACFFIVEPSAEDLSELVALLKRSRLASFVAEKMPLAEARRAYERKSRTRGKIVLITDEDPDTFFCPV